VTWQESSVVIATRYRLGGPRIESQLGRIFRTGPDRSWGQPHLLCSWYRAPLSGIQRPQRGGNHPPLCRTEVKESVVLKIYRQCEPSWLVIGATLVCLTKNFVYYTYSRTQLYFTQQYSRNTTTCFGPICGLSSGCDITYRAAIQEVWVVFWGAGGGEHISLFQ